MKHSEAKNGGLAVIAIDPGTPLTVVFAKADDSLAVYECSLNFEGLASVLKDWTSKLSPLPAVVCEAVTIRPGENLASGSRFVGSMYGAWGVCAALGLPFYFAAPTWKVKMRVPGKGVAGATARICEMAGNVFPNSAYLFASPSKHHNRADAALLAHWYRTHVAG